MSFLQAIHCPSHHAGVDVDVMHPSEFMVSMAGLPRVLQAVVDLSDLETLVKSCGNTGKDESKSAGKDGFQMCLDVRQYQPNEISVKTVNNSIIVEAKHEEKPDKDGYISRQFTRRYVLPERYRAEDVISSLSSDGILTVKATPPPTIAGNTRHIEIQQTGPARRNNKTNKVDAAKTTETTKNGSNDNNLE